MVFFKGKIKNIYIHRKKSHTKYYETLMNRLNFLISLSNRLFTKYYFHNKHFISKTNRNCHISSKGFICNFWEGFK